MKLLHLADLHEGSTLYGYKREEAMQSALAFVLEKSQELKPVCAVVSGDLFHTRTPSQSSRERINNFLCALGEICPVLALAGNHDSARLFSADRRPFASARVTMISYETMMEENTVRHPYVFDGGGLGICALPWLPDMCVRNYASEKNIPAASVQPELFAQGDCRIIAGHATVEGARLPHAVSSDTLPSDMDTTSIASYQYCAFGHIHLPQTFGHVRYPGSLFALDFSENFEHSLTFFDTEKDHTEIFPVPQTERLAMADCESFEQWESFLNGVDRSLPCWIKVVWRGETRENIRQELEEFLPDGCELLCVQHVRNEAVASLSPFIEGEELHELVPEEVFDRLLEARKVLVDQRLPLRREFAKLVRSVRKEA